LRRDEPAHAAVRPYGLLPILLRSPHLPPPSPPPLHQLTKVNILPPPPPDALPW